MSVGSVGDADTDIGATVCGTDTYTGAATCNVDPEHWETPAGPT